uniref:Putative secreted protein n=1 Tax=Anopheles darlingi TaxID=43151 RepID=A0A2M4D6Y4_ANODA
MSMCLCVSMCVFSVGLARESGTVPGRLSWKLHGERKRNRNPGLGGLSNLRAQNAMIRPTGTTSTGHSGSTLWLCGRGLGRVKISKHSLSVLLVTRACVCVCV